MTTTSDQTRLPLRGPVEVHPVRGVAGAIAPKPASPGAGVFLSPRVIDEQAFEDYAGRLRSLLDESSTAASDARSILDELRSLSSNDAVKRQKTLVEAGAKLVKVVDAKTAQLDGTRSETESLIQRLEAAASKATSASSDIDERLDAALTQRTAAFEKRIDERVRTLSAEFESKIEARVSAITAQLTRVNETREALETIVRDATENTLVALDDAHSRAANLAGWDPVDIVDGAGVGQPTRDSLADLMQRAEAKQREALGAIDALACLKDDAAALVGTLTTSLDTTRTGLCELDVERESLEHRVEAATLEARRVGEGAKALMELNDRAGITAKELASLLAESRSLREQDAESEARLRDAVRSAHAAIAELKPWHEVCFTSPEDAQRVSLPPVLQAIANRFQDGLARDIGDMASALRTVADRAG